VRPLLGEPTRGRSVSLPLNHLAYKAFVGRFVGEVRMTAKEQRLLPRALRPKMRLLDHPVFVRFARLNPGRAQPVMLEHAAEALRQLPPAAPFELVRRVVSTRRFGLS
jgi:hypothetical protein